MPQISAQRFKIRPGKYLFVVLFFIAFISAGTLVHSSVNLTNTYTNFEVQDSRPESSPIITTDGEVDLGFLNGLNGANGEIQATVVQPDGKIVIGGLFLNVNDLPRARIARLNSDGTLDTGFLNGLSGADSFVIRVALQPDGKILIGGWFLNVNGVTRNRIARLNSDGSLDLGFLNGLSGANAQVHAFGVQPDGKILVGGIFTSINGVSRNRLARLNTDGTVDTGFLNGLTGANGIIHTFVVLSDGKILIGGGFSSINGVPRNRLARLNPDGTLDNGFLNGLSGIDGIEPIVVQPDGKILIGGSFSVVNGMPRNGIARLNSDGTLDTGFLNGLSGIDNQPESIILQPDGKVLIGGWFLNVNGTPRNRLARLNSDGTLDIEFLNGLSGVDMGVIHSMVMQPDGKILIGGSLTIINGISRNRIARLLNSLWWSRKAGQKTLSC